MIRPLKSILPAALLLCLPGRGTAAEWEVLPSSTQETLHKVFFADPRVGFISGDHGTLLTTLDGGKTWSRRDLPYQEDLMSVWFTDARIGFLCGRHGLILRSDDSGRTWDCLPVPAGLGLNDIAFPSPGTGFAVGADDSIAGSAYLYEAYFFGPDTGFIADVDYGGLLGTTDGMASYGSILPTQINRIHFLDRQIGYATHGGERCYRTADGGKTWSQDSSFDRRKWGNLQITDLASSGDRALILIGEKGLIARKEEEPGSSTALAAEPARKGIRSRRREAFRADGRRSLRQAFQAPFPAAVQE